MFPLTLLQLNVVVNLCYEINMNLLYIYFIWEKVVYKQIEKEKFKKEGNRHWLYRKYVLQSIAFRKQIVLQVTNVLFTSSIIGILQLISVFNSYV